ncbi:hypothetical protein F3J24_17920 [Comamonas sp. Tr-654]|uniref:hypothetical protein n=1 Tax=Comamonas sp. Tr-654 TaxID=2608341 RepID=UPI0014223130|nr:hypothetical protein [Comamonas sp. Tr-654]NIF85389.1 hypothetical protein [Comamonas sp. Tr-654]
MTDTTKRIARLGHLSNAQKEALGAVLNALQGLPPDDAQEVLDHAIAHLAGDEHTPMFARGIAGPLGKLDHELKTKVDEVTFHRFRRSCALMEIDTSARIRDAIYVLEWKKPYWQMVAEKRSHEAEHSQGLQALVGHAQAPEFGGHGR